MSLPTVLQPAWPLFKRVHRFLTLVLGAVFRTASPVLGSRGVPRSATTSSRTTAADARTGAVLHPGGPAEEIQRGPAVGEPVGHWVFERAYRARVPARYALELREGALVGLHGAAVTKNNVLDYQTSGYFGIGSWREHPLYLRPTIGRVERLEGTVLSLTTRGTASNYYHFLFDSIGRLGVLEEAMPEERPDAVVVPHQARYQRELLDLVGVDSRLVQPRQGVAIRADRLLVPSTPNQDLDAPPWLVSWLRKRLPPAGVPVTSGRIYITRGRRPNTRRYVQEEQLWPELQRRGFTMLDPGTLSVQEQIDVFHAAEVVVAPHGAALTNLTFCQPGVRVLEMFAGSYVHLGLWTICEAIGGIDYRYLVGAGAPRRQRPMTGVLDDVSIPVHRVLRCVDELLD